MEKNKVLSKVIKKAIKNGWFPKDILPAFPLLTDHPSIKLLIHMYQYWIFSHKFAKAFFPERVKHHACNCKAIVGEKHQKSCATQICIHCKKSTRLFNPSGYCEHYDNACDVCRLADLDWKEHLQEMVVEKDPVKYLEKFL